MDIKPPLYHQGIFPEENPSETKIYFFISIVRRQANTLSLPHGKPGQFSPNFW